MRKEKSIINTLTHRQRKDLLNAYEHNNHTSNFGRGLKTGWALNRKGLVKLAEIQLDNWTMWVITPEGKQIAEQLINE